MFKYIGAASVYFAALHLGARHALPEYFRTRQARLFVVLCLIATLSYFTKSLPDPIEASPFLSYASFLLLFFVTVTLVDSVYRLRVVMLVAVGAVAFASLYLIREWQRSHALYANFRPGWVVGDPNYFAVSALLAIPFAFYLMLESKRPWERWFCAGCLMLILVAVTLGASRGGFLGLLASFAFVVWNSRARLRNLVVACGLVLPLSLLLPISPVSRLLHPNPGDTDAEDSRTVLWDAGFRMIETHPIAGIGLGNFKPLVREYEPADNPVDHIAHNSYIEIASEMGLPALVIFLGILSCSFRALGRVRASSMGPPFISQAAVSLQAGLLGAAVAIFFVSGEYQKLLWLVVFLSVCVPTIARQYADRRLAGI